MSKKLWLVIAQEFNILVQKKLLIILSSVIIVLWIVALTISLSEYKHEAANKAFYKNHHRQMWESQFPKNPHMAAHFGTFAFRPANPLSLFDKGISNFSGTFIYLEAHRQNDFVCSPAQNSSIHIRMGEFNISFLLQFAIPLLLISITAGMFALEKQNGLLAFITTNSIKTSTLFLGKSLALFGFIFGLMIMIFVGTISVALLVEIEWNSSQIFQLFCLFCIYSLFYYILICKFLIISLYATNYKSAFVTHLFLWVVMFFVLPKLAATLADDAYKLPSNLSFRDEIKKDIDNGMDGHSRGDREKILIDSLLKVYKVDSTYKMPVNIDGIMLLKGEQYSANVYNIHFSKLDSVLKKQQTFNQYISFLSPLIAMRNISMSLCNNNIANDFDFRRKAEDYRFYFAQELNTNMMLYSKENEFDTYKVGSDLFAKIKDFNYTPLSFSNTFNIWKNDIIILLILLGTLLFYVLRFNK